MLSQGHADDYELLLFGLECRRTSITNTYEACIDCGQGRSRGGDLGGRHSYAQINFWCALNKPPLPDYLGQRLHCCQPQRRRRLLQNILNCDFIFIKSWGFSFCMLSTCGTWIYLVDCRWMNFYGMQIYCSNTFRFSRYQIMFLQCGQPLKSFGPNCPSCVSGLHLKPDNSYDSATVCNTYANISNRLSRLSCLCSDKKLFKYIRWNVFDWAENCLGAVGWGRLWGYRLPVSACNLYSVLSHIFHKCDVTPLLVGCAVAALGSWGPLVKAHFVSSTVN